jgi:AAA-like domain
MTVDEAIAIVDLALAPDRLSQVQQLVFCGCWEGKTYQEIAELAGYDADYLRVIGSRLWSNLSEVFGERTTKGNLQSVLRHQAQVRSQQARSGSLPGGPAGLDSPALSASGPSSSGSSSSGPSSSGPSAPGLSAPGLSAPGLSPDEESRGKPLLDFPGSPLSANSSVYVKRLQCEATILEAIQQPGAMVRLKAPTKWGKTSLLNQLIESIQRQRYHWVRINVQQADTSCLGDLDRFLRWFCANLTQQLGLRSQLEQFWDIELGSKVSCATYLQAYVLAQIQSPLVLVIDELQRMFEHPGLAQDFLPLLRVWHEESKNSAQWNSLRLLVVYSTDSYVPLQLNQSPFNVGLPVQLGAFSEAQAQDLAQRHRLSWLNAQELATLQRLVNGHPYLLHLAMYHLSGTPRPSFEQLMQEASTQTGIYGQHLRHYLSLLQREPHLGQTFKAIIASDRPIIADAVPTYRLESMGLVRMQGDLASPGCELYRRYFGDRLEQF